MIFVDEARIFVQAGPGGKGCESFHKEKFHRHPRPDGGDGGKGGDIVVIADRNKQTLLDFKYKQHYKAKNGGHGGSRSKKGKEGQSCELLVPVGTLVKDFETKLMIRDLASHGDRVIIARGGKGGIGNDHKKLTVPAEQGEERTVILELKLIADVGLVGFPNAGKSTIVSAISKVKSKVANYPFTTKQPILGIVSSDDFNFIVADLPGIIEGAHEGKGLGHRFLRHAERTKILVQVIDMAGTDYRDPLEDYRILNEELVNYKEFFIQKKRIVVANKMDMPQSKENLERFKQKYKCDIIQISAQKKEGLDFLVEQMKELLCLENSQEK